MESENPLLLLLPLHLMTLNVSCYTVHFLKYWFMSNLVQIKSTRNIFGIKKKFEKIFDIHLLYHVYIIPGFNG